MTQLLLRSLPTLSMLRTLYLDLAVNGSRAWWKETFSTVSFAKNAL